MIATALIAGLLLLLSTTGPNPPTLASGTIQRFGGVCLELERWQLIGWRTMGQSYSVTDIQEGLWHEPVDDPPCVAVPEQIYLVRPPFDSPDGAYRICPLLDDEPCLEFSRVPFEGTPGP